MLRETMDEIYNLSDTVILKKAEQIIDNQRKTVSNAQMKNLENVCLSLKNIEFITTFVNHQIEKNKNKYFYSAVKDCIEKDIKKISEGISEKFPGKKVEETQYLLAKEFIQHLVCANMYKNERRQHNDERNR